MLIKRLCNKPARRIVLAMAFAGVLGFTAQVGAVPTLDGDTVTVEYDDGLGFGSETQSVLVAAGVEIVCCSNAIGAILLDGESVDIGGLSITYVIQGGLDLLSPGYTTTGQGPTAFMEFTGLDIFDPVNPLNTHSIVGVDTLLDGVIGVSASDITFTGDSVRLFLSDDIGVDDTDDLGSITLNLQIRTTEPPPPSVPVPGSLALLGLGLVALAGRRRNARCSAVRRSMV
jgi:hypothetical protein